MTVAVKDNPEAGQFEMRVDGQFAGLVGYRREGKQISLTHTEVDPTFEGKGLGSTLVRETLKSVRAEGLSVKPYCPFVRRFISRHPQYLDLVPAEIRVRFGLDVDPPPSGRHPR